MKITSPVFEHDDLIPSKYTCDGENVNPPLEFSEVPEGAVSLVLIMDDPDVPTSIKPDGMWDHWLVWDMPSDTKSIPEATISLPGTVGQNTSGSFGYTGPCPPDKEHRYFFKLYALDTKLEFDIDVSKKDIEAAMEGHILEHMELMGRYDRPR